MASSKIEDLIQEIEDYLDNCKFQPLSNTKIIVNKEEIDSLVSDLKKTTPEELSKYQKVVSNQQAILSDAKKKAKDMIDQAAAQTNELINQNSIMKQAYAQADEVVKSAYQEARDILTTATIEANELRSAAVEYMDNMLSSYESLVSQTMRLTQGHYESFYSQLSSYYDVVVSNRMELCPPTMETSELQTDMINAEASANGDTAAMSATGSLGATGPMSNTGSLSQTGSFTSKPSGATGPMTGKTGEIKLM